MHPCSRGGKKLSKRVEGGHASFFFERMFSYLSSFIRNLKNYGLDFLQTYAEPVKEAMGRLNLPETPETLYGPQSYILNNSGKLIRPILSLMACGLCRKPVEQALPAALAVELAHNFTLIHDDIMDQAELRRGVPSVHKKWDESTAILSGDGLFVLSMMQLHQLPETADFRKANRIYLEGVNRVCEGQALDMEFEKRMDVTPEEYLEMIGGKTAALLSASLMLGGVAAGAADEEMECLDEIGRSLGTAFQIQDDLLDVIADPETFGKKCGGDISEGKKTFLMVTTLERCSPKEREWLLQKLENRPVNEADRNKVMEMYESLGVLDAAKELMADYYGRARTALNRFEDSQTKQDFLKLINYLQHRDS